MVQIIDFWAEWCGPCKMMEPILAEAEQAFSGKVGIVKINVDEDQEKASKYGILSIPTYVIEKDGKEVDRIIGFTQKNMFFGRIKKHVE